jgi:thiopeptide-type bacteriocin biosynthesis protein
MAARPAGGYEPAGEPLLRASTDLGGLDLPAELGRTDPQSGAVQAAWLARIWERDEVRAALAAASPALCEQITGILAGGQTDRPSAGRVLLAVASYLLRWQRRSTPFGLFAGTCLATTGGASQVQLHGQHAVVRPDVAWLGDVIAGLERNRDLLARLDVMASDAATARGERVSAPGPVTDGIGQELAPAEVSVRGTQPVLFALDAAREPVAAGKLAAELCGQFPHAGMARAAELIDGLIAQGLMVTSLRAPMTCTDPLGYVCDRLQSVHAEDIAGAAAAASGLREVRDTLRAAAADGRPAPVTLAGQMSTMSQAVAMPLAVDTVLDGKVCVPGQVAREAADSAAVLCQVSPFPFGEPAWLDYHARFLDRYGSGAAVPVLDLVADSGLGFPAGYAGSACGLLTRPLTRRDTALPALIQQAMADGFREITLTSQLIGELAGDAAHAVRLPPRAEIAVEIRASSLTELDRGRFTLLVTGAPPPASSMIGRHASYLPAADRDLLAAGFAGDGQGRISAQLSFVPRIRRNENVTRACQLLPAIIPLGEHRRDDPCLIRLAELAVTADEEGLGLVRLSTGEPVDVRVPHALEARVHMPPLARFIAEAGLVGHAAYMPFDFGATASTMPWLPRVRYRRTILSPARWQLQAGSLPGPDAPQEAWEKAFHAWRDKWRVPDSAAITDHDRRQPADLRHQAHLRLLRARLQRAGHIELREAASPQDLAWIGRAHELVFPLRTTAAARLPGPVAVRGRAPHRPGIMRARITSHPGRFDEIVAGPLPQLVSALGGRVESWWFRCHGQPGTPGRHLALYLTLPSADSYPAVADDIASWAAGLGDLRLASGLQLDRFQLPAGRYGTGPAETAARAVFTADSAAAIAQASISQGGLDRAAITAASLASLAVSLAPSAGEGMRWLTASLPREHVRLDPAARGLALRLAGPEGTGSLLARLPGGDRAGAAWEERSQAVRRYRTLLEGQRDPRDVLLALLNEHLARALLPHPGAERAAAQLARACALHSLATQDPPACP